MLFRVKINVKNGTLVNTTVEAPASTKALDRVIERLGEEALSLPLAMAVIPLPDSEATYEDLQQAITNMGLARTDEECARLAEFGRLSYQRLRQVIG